jgi:hypothetical protein
MLAFRFRREHPWKWGVLAFLVAGLALITLAFPGEPFWRCAAWFAAFAWLVSGGITLWLYVRRTHRAAEVE